MPLLIHPSSHGRFECTLLMSNRRNGFRFSTDTLVTICVAYGSVLRVYRRLGNVTALINELFRVGFMRSSHCWFDALGNIIEYYSHWLTSIRNLLSATQISYALK